MEILTRTHKRTLNISDNRRVSFYCAVFGEVADVYEPGQTFPAENYRERFAPGAFDYTLRHPTTNVIATVDHDRTRTFASQETGLILQEDKHGLFASAWVPETDLGDKIIRDVADGILTGASIRYAEIHNRTVEDGNPKPLVERTSVHLIDVCLTDDPAYQGTEVHLRTANRYQEFFRRLRLTKLRALDLHNERKLSKQSE